MRYPPGHKQKSRRELLDKAARLAKRQGFAGTGIDQLAAAAGVTSGALYGQFGSKAGLLRALVEQELEASAQRLEPDDGDALARLAAGYLSRAHVEHPEAGCALPALSAEVARADAETRQAYEQALLRLHARMAALTGDPQRAWVALAQSVGAVLLARAMDSEASREALLGATRRALRGDAR